MAFLPPCDPPRILLLPEELLLEIFTTVKIYRPNNEALHPAYASSSSDIAAVRLTCRRFAAISSHLLVHYICLDGINLHSLNKLESVSRHPLLRKGVSIVRLESRCYATNLAKDSRKFARWAVGKVLGMAQCYKGNFENEEKIADLEDSNEVTKWDELAGVLRKLRIVLDTWISMSKEGWESDPIHQSGETGTDDWHNQLSDIGGCAESEPHVQLLREAHVLYRRRYEEQEELRKDNAFASRFAAAMSRMPKATCLEFQDFHDEPDWCVACGDKEGETHAVRGVRGADEYAGLLDINALLEPMSWDDIQAGQRGSPPAELIFTLPLALQSAGCKLDSILVRTATPAENYYPLIRNSINTNFSALGYAINTMGLKSFAFVHDIDPMDRVRKTPALEDCEAFKDYITAMTSSDNIERFRLALDSGWVDGDLDYENILPFGSLLLPTSSRSLRDIHVTGLPLRLEELSKMHSMLAEDNISLDFLTISGLRLFEGTWKEALDILREMEITDKEVLEPTGAECDSPLVPLYGGYWRIFGTSLGHGNEAGRFINGKLERNPLNFAHA